MAKKSSKSLVAAAAAFAASPQGRKLLQLAKEYASRPETKQKAQQLISQVQQARARSKGGSSSARFTAPVQDSPPYGTPPKR